MKNYFKRIGSISASGIVVFDDARPGPRPNPSEYVVWKRSPGLEHYREVGEAPDYFRLLKLSQSDNPAVEARAAILLGVWRRGEWRSIYDQQIADLEGRVAA